MRILYCFEYEENKCVSETNDVWVYSLDQSYKQANFCFTDIDNNTFISETVPYGYVMLWLRKIAESGYVNLENHIFKMEDNDE